MFDRSFAEWWLGRVAPYRDVPSEKLAADREAAQKQQEYNRNYATFLNEAVLPAIDTLTQFLRQNRVIHRVSTWGNQIALRVHLTWRWGELVITQSHEDCFIGARAFLMPGVIIGQGAVIGACSVVTSDMPAWTICAGNPCKPLRPRHLAAAAEQAVTPSA